MAPQLVVLAIVITWVCGLVWLILSFIPVIDILLHYHMPCVMVFSIECLLGFGHLLQPVVLVASVIACAGFLWILEIPWVCDLIVCRNVIICIAIAIIVSRIM